MKNLRFDYRDMFRAPRIGLSLQRMWIQLVGLIIGFAGYLLLTYLSFWAAGLGLSTTWNKYGLIICPFMSGDKLPFYSWILFGIGALVLVCAYLISATAVARAAYMVLKGNNFYTWRESYRFAFRKLGALVATPAAIAALIGLALLGAVVVGLLGRIPFVGELGVGFFSLIWILGSLLIFFFALVLGISFLLAPAILATTDEDAFEATFQTFSCIWSQPWRFLFYQAINVGLALLSFAILAFFVKQAFLIMNGLLGSTMGNDFINLASNGLYYVQKWTLLAEDLLVAVYSTWTPRLFFAKDFFFIPGLPVTVQIAAIFYALTTLFIGGWVISLALSSLNVGHTLFFLALRKIKDEENLLERKDKEEEIEEDTPDSAIPEPEHGAADLANEEKETGKD